jgi:alkanesulfonate monooxygenase SsuD/methylene tetrahydromethanopterin reductase-like flavin-dependent oxidoreductase (luciferase family)
MRAHYPCRVPRAAQQQRESPLIGTPDEIVAKLQTLRAAGVEYVLNAACSRANLRRFAREVMPHVAVQHVEPSMLNAASRAAPQTPLPPE